jgi:hypothetical protein
MEAWIIGVFSGQNHSSPEQVLSKLKGWGAKLVKIRHFFLKNKSFPEQPQSKLKSGPI